MTDAHRQGLSEQEAKQPLTGEVVRRYVQPLPGEVVKYYRQAQPLPGRQEACLLPQPDQRGVKRRRRRRIALGILIMALAGAVLGAVWLMMYQKEAPPAKDSEDEKVEEEEPAGILLPTYPWGGGVRMRIRPEHGAELTPQEIYEKVNPSVVTVMVWFEDEGGSVGTGVILTGNGYILTNYHVLDEGTTCHVMLNTGVTYEARYVAGDQYNDIGIIRINANGLPAAEIGNSDELVVGDPVYAIGNPLGTELRGTFTDGIVSAIDRDVEVEGRTMTLIQTNAALNTGNSGGPLINRYGQVVGINTVKMSSSYSTIEGLGFALPTSAVHYLVNDLLTYGEVRPEPQLGVTVTVLPVTLPDGTQGIEVQELTEGYPAANAGMKVGDILVYADGQPIRSSQELLRLRRGLEVGDELTVTVWRDGAYLDLTLHLDVASEQK